MARTSILEDLFKVSKQVPWWASTALGAGLYFLFKHYLPTAVPETLSTAWTPLFATFAYLLLGICLAGTAAGLIKRWQDRRRYDRQTSIESIRALSWQDFERFVLEAFRRQGYEARTTGGGADGGVDLILKKNGRTTLVQCKQWRSSSVGVKPVRELAGVVASEGAHQGIFVGSGTFTSQARDFALRANIRLLGGAELEGLIRPIKQTADAQDPTLKEPSTNCPKCGDVLVTRTAKRGAHAGETFLGCNAFPRCRYTRNA